MIFSSHVFVFLFLPVVLIGYYLLGKCRAGWPSKLLLALASLFFYGFFNWTYLLLILGSIAVNAVAGRMIFRYAGRPGAKIGLAAGVLFNVVLLGYFKYANFFVSNINSMFTLNWTMEQVILPLGISFFTFQQIAYVYEIYSGKLKEQYDLITYTLFVCYFPQLIAGPIVLPDEMIPQFENPENRKLNFNNMSAGFWLFSLGMAKKLIVADYFSTIAINGYNSPELLLTGDAWMAMLAFNIQIYFDFSAYSDMAIGLGLMFNIRIPVNFNSPYKSASISEFWRTWHITLGRFFATYLYFPLGGSRKGKSRTLINLFVVAFICGIWHGAGWFYIIWGCLHGVAMVCNRIWSDILHMKMARWLGVAITFLYINLISVVFRSENSFQFYNMMKSLFHWSGANHLFADFAWNTFWATMGALFVIFCLPNAVSKLDSFRLTRWRVVETVVCAVGAVLFMSRISPFIYFNF